MRKTKVIALVTDFGLEDNYAGVVKGVILKIHPNVSIVDICHLVGPQNIVRGALALKTAYAYFPKGTVFVAVVDPGVGTKRRPIIVKTPNYVFVAPDNGLLWPTLAEEKPTAIYTIEKDRYFLKPVSQTFHGRDIFAPVAAYISKGVPPSRFGRAQKKIVQLMIPEPRLDLKNNVIEGEVLDIDHFGNLITNVTSSHLEVFEGDPVIEIQEHSILNITASYGAVQTGELLGIIGSQGYLEIAVNGASAADELGVGRGDPLKIVFK